MKLSLGVLAALAIEAPDAAVYRREVLRHLSPLGFAEAVFVTNVPRQARENVTASGHAEEMDQVRLHWPRLMIELGPVFRHNAAHGVTRVEDAMPLARYRRSFLYREIYRRRALDRFVHVRLAVPGHPSALIGLIRARGERPFSDTAVHSLSAVRPVVALGDAARRASAPVLDGELLRAGDRELIPLLALGYTNEQIAIVLSRSPNTVRNRLARLFRRAGVATRAELLGRLGAGT